MKLSQYNIPIASQDANFNSLDCKKLDLLLGEKPEQYLQCCEDFLSNNTFKFVARQIGKVRILKCNGYILWIIAMLINTATYAMPIINEAKSPYRIEGSTPQQLREAMNENGPKEHEQTYDAYTSWIVRWNYEYQKDESQCRISALKIAADITYHLPEWAGYYEADQAFKDRWDNYIAHLITHEHGHAEHGKNAAVEIEGALSALPPAESCEDIAQIVDNKANKIIAKYNEQDIQYDAETEHGKKQGAEFP